MASAIGALTNPNKLQKTFKSVNNSKITATTITKYIEYLEDAFLNVIYNELRMRGFHVDVENLTVVEKSKDAKPVKKQLEVDFICNTGYFNHECI